MADHDWLYRMVDPKDDPRSVDELFSAALCELDEDLAWDAIEALQWRGTEEVLREARRLCESYCPLERRVGADVLGKLGLPERTFCEECVQTLLAMLEAEQDHQVQRAILAALSHLNRPEAVIPSAKLARHENAEVRHAVVLALMGQEDCVAIETLIELTRDRETHVRDWATFALGVQVEVDTPELREALVERLADEDANTRAEAIVGLAEQGDRRMLPALREELTSGSVGTLAVEAAALIQEPQLHPLLVALQGWWDVDETLLEEAVSACSPPPEV